MDNFGLPVGAHSNAWRAVIRPQMAERVLLEASSNIFDTIMVIFDGSHLPRGCTPNLGPQSTKLGGTIRATKIYSTHNGVGPDRNTEIRPFLRFPEIRKLGQKYIFCYSNHPKLAILAIFIWEKGTFYF